MTQKLKIIVGISGASGSIYGKRILEILRDEGVESHLVITKAGRLTLAQELGCKQGQLEGLSSFCYRDNEIGSRIASGSFLIDGMIIAPCSANSLAAIACGISSNLLARAADVTLKERRKLVLLVRETPLHLQHIRNMMTITEMGGIVMPPLPAFYSKPGSIDEMVDDSVRRALDLLGIHTGDNRRWQGIKKLNDRAIEGSSEGG